MNEQKVIKKQLLKNMGLNFIAFTIIFTVFSVIIYNQVANSLYRSVDKELLEDQKRLVQSSSHKKTGDMLLNEGQAKQEEIPTLPNKTEQPNGRRNSFEKLVNPRFIFILRNEAGEVINESSIGRFYEDYQGEIEFDAKRLDTIYRITIAEQYQYRAVNFETVDENGQKVYGQLLANVDGEQTIITNFTKTLVIGTTVTIILSIIASYILSKRTLQPITKSWQKQVEFVQNASHELRTPLTIIQTKQELLLQEPDKKIIDKSEDIILTLKETRRLTKLIKDLMTLARADSDKIELVKEEVDIDQLLKEICMPYSDYASSQEKHFMLNLNYQDKIKVDPNYIHQLMVILLDNAIKYTESNDTITIQSDKKEGKCIITVKDSGIGISKDGMEHVFDRFYREDKARSRQTGGTGLGLSIADWIVSAHKGTIKVTSNTPKGTIVTIRLSK